MIQIMIVILCQCSIWMAVWAVLYTCTGHQSRVGELACWHVSEMSVMLYSRLCGQCACELFQYQGDVGALRHRVTAVNVAVAWWQSFSTKQTQPEADKSQPG